MVKVQYAAVRIIVVKGLAREEEVVVL